MDRAWKWRRLLHCRRGLAARAQAALVLGGHDHSLGWLAFPLVAQAGHGAANGPCGAHDVDLLLHGHCGLENDLALLESFDPACLLGPHLSAQGGARAVERSWRTS